MSSSSSSRPTVKRQYGTNKSSTNITRPRWSLASPASVPSSSSSLPLPSSSSTPPTSPVRASHSTATLSSTDDPRPLTRMRERPLSLKTVSLRGAKADLRHFFHPVSPPRKTGSSIKRAHAALDSDDDNDSQSTDAAATEQENTRPRTACVEKRRKTTPSSTLTTLFGRTRAPPGAPPPKLEQLYLDPFETAGHATLSCVECDMSYARTPDDMALHARHHKRVVGGCDWVAGEAGRGVTVVRDDVEYGDGKQGAKLLMVDGVVDGQALSRRMRDLLDTIDTQLSSSSLSREQLTESKLFIIVTPQRKVIACAVVQRIQAAYEVVVSRQTDNSQTSDSNSSSSSQDPSLLRFGDDESAIFCSSTALPTLLGVHRIWTCAAYRRQNLATMLLDAMAKRFIYGCPIASARRGQDVAFSQPTGKGKALATRWTGVANFRVFVD